MATATRRPATAAPKPPTSLASNCVIAETASLTGSKMVTIAANTILHPRAMIVTTHSPVMLGEGCIICERASIGQLTAEAHGNSRDVVLDRNVVVEAGAVVEAEFVGEGTIVELGAKVGRGAVLGKHCKITPLSIIPPGQILPDFTIVYGSNERRIEASGLEDLRDQAHRRHLEVLRRLIPSNLAKWQ